MADYDEHPGTASSSSGHGHNIPILLGNESGINNRAGTHRRWVPDGLKSASAQILFFVVLYSNFVTSVHHHNMYSTYRITQDRISDAINALHDGDYSNPTAAARAFGVNPKTVQRRLCQSGTPIH